MLAHDDTQFTNKSRSANPPPYRGIPYGTASRETDPVWPRVLVVEDNDDLRELVKTWLEAHDFEVAEACNGAEALAWLEAGHRPAVILLDLMMPVMDGREVLERLGANEELSSIPVVVMSACARDEVPVKHFLPKPIGWDTLTALVNALTGKTRA